LCLLCPCFEFVAAIAGARWRDMRCRFLKSISIFYLRCALSRPVFTLSLLCPRRRLRGLDEGWTGNRITPWMETYGDA
jgi:hypothetical protein